MPNVTQAEFARIMGVDRSTVTRTWKQPGRLVMVGDLVDVEASRARIAETADPTRADVASRHAAARAGKSASTTKAPATQPAYAQAASAAPPPPAEPGEDGTGMSYQAARAVKEKYMALKARADYEQQIGHLLAREDVDAAMRFIGATIRGLAEIVPDQMAPILAPMNTPDQIHGALTESMRDYLQRVGHAIEQQRAVLRKLAE